MRVNDLSYVDQAGIAALRRLLDRALGIARSPDWIRLLLAKPPIRLFRISWNSKLSKISFLRD